MIYIDKLTQKEYKFIEKDKFERYILERETDELGKDGKITKEGICVPENVLKELYELKETD